MPKLATFRVPFSAILRRVVWQSRYSIWVALFALSLATLASAPCGKAQTAATASTAAQAGLEPIRKYIADGWDTLTRSLDECKSIVDTKLATASVLYLPADFDVPPAVQKLQAECKVEAKNLPMVIP